MSRCYISQEKLREWIKEEIITYLGWSKTEIKWVRAVMKDMGDKPLIDRR